jgi:hypothetical protein
VVSQLDVVVEFGETCCLAVGVGACESGWNGGPVQQVDAAVRALWVWGGDAL